MKKGTINYNILIYKFNSLIYYLKISNLNCLNYSDIYIKQKIQPTFKKRMCQDWDQVQSQSRSQVILVSNINCIFLLDPVQKLVLSIQFRFWPGPTLFKLPYKFQFIHSYRTFFIFLYILIFKCNGEWGIVLKQNNILHQSQSCPGFGPGLGSVPNKKNIWSKTWIPSNFQTQGGPGSHHGPFQFMVPVLMVNFGPINVVL